jgi:LysR family hydrogen peroxide-inducible transcriptional activator
MIENIYICKMISLIQLEYAVAVDTYRHFATAAEKCFVSQPTLSMQLKKMEEELGIILFDRGRQPIIPTDAGIKIIEQARQVLKENKKISLLAKDLKGEVSGELRIGVIPTIAPYLLPLFVGDFNRKYPSVRLIVDELITEEIEEKLHLDLIDVGILVTPLHNTNIYEKPLYYEEMQIYTNEKHKLANKSIIEVKDIALPDIWLLSDGHCFRNQVVNLCNLQSLNHDSLPFDFESGSLETIIKIIDKEGGFTLIPELAGNEIKDTKENNLRYFSDITPLREVSLVFSRQFAKTKLIELLANEIQNSVPNYMLSIERGTLVEWR